MSNLDVLLRFVTDKKSQAEAKAAVKDVASSMTAQAQAAIKGNAEAGKLWTANAQQMGLSVKDAAAQMAQFAGTTEKQILADVAAFDSLKKGADSAAESVQKVTKNTDTLSKTVRRGISGFSLLFAGRQLVRMSQMGLSPISKYVTEYGTMERTSSRWLAAQDRIKNSMLDLGRVMAQQLAPTIEKLADLAERVAQFAKENPGAAKAATFLMAGGVVAGWALQLVGVTQLVRILAGKAIGGAASRTAAGAVAAGGLAASSAVLPGVGLGLMGYQGLTQTEWGKERGLATLGQYATVIAHGIGSIFGKGDEWALSIGRLTGAIKSADNATEELTGQFAGLTDSQMAAYASYRKEELDATKQYQDQRADIISGYNEKIAQDETNYQRAREKTMRDFYSNEQKYERDYQADRLRVARDAGIEIERIEEDHQRRMRDLAEEHDDKMQDLISNRDAMGIIRERRDYQRERRNEEEQTNIEIRRRRQDTALRLQEMAVEFNAQRKQRLDDFQQQMKDAEEEKKIQRQQAEADFRQQLNDLQKHYNEERARRREAFIASLQELSGALTQGQLLIRQFGIGVLSDLRALIAAADVPTTGNYQGRQSGGYVSAGLYRMHDKEFVLNRTTTQMLERMSGQRLSQNTIMQLAAGGGPGRIINYYDHRRIDGRLLPEDRRAIKQDTADLLGSLLA